MENGFIESHVDYSLFIYHHGPVHIFLLIYMVDIIITGNHPATINLPIGKLRSYFVLKDLDDLSYFLGIQAIRNSEGLHLHQSKYIIDLLNCVNMSDSKPYHAPCIAGSKMSKFDGEALQDPTAYRHVVGALQYVVGALQYVILTRPNIAYSVNQLCQHMHNPTTVHWTATKRVLRYLNGSVDSGLFFNKGLVSINAFCDSNWAGNPDDRRSTTGFCIFLGSNLIPGQLRSNMLFLSQAPRLNIIQFPLPLLTCFGFECFFVNCRSLFLLLQFYGVTTREL